MWEGIRSTRSPFATSCRQRSSPQKSSTCAVRINLAKVQLEFTCQKQFCQAKITASTRYGATVRRPTLRGDGSAEPFRVGRSRRSLRKVSQVNSAPRACRWVANHRYQRKQRCAKWKEQYLCTPLILGSWRAATDDPSQVGAVDVVLPGVKAWQVPDAAQATRSLIGPETSVVPLQNGVEAPAQLAAVSGAQHVFAGLARIISFKVGPGPMQFPV